jgi:hypothetical protein
MQSVRAIIPRTQLIDPHALWFMRSFFSIPLCPGVSINCAISGTHWIDRRLEAFEFNNKIRFQTMEARLRAAPEREISSLVMERELPDTGVEPVFTSVPLEQAYWRL